jgi:hypothetical protein
VLVPLKYLEVIPGFMAFLLIEHMRNYSRSHYSLTLKLECIEYSDLVAYKFLMIAFFYFTVGLDFAFFDETNKMD